MGRIKELEELILHHKIIYYHGKPEISDAKYDQLEDELKKLDPENKVLKVVGSTDLSKGKVKHERKMLSLEKTYEEKGLKSWMKDREVVSTFKLDGVACSLIYEKGTLTLAKTRGDGIHGENITPKILWIPNVPNKLDNQEKLEIRGEVYCTEADFFHLSNEMVSMGLDKPTSQRNIVAGLMGRKENLELCRFLEFQAFDYLVDGRPLKTEMEKFTLLKKFGLQIAEVELHKDFSSVKAAIKRAENFMSTGEYQIDGLVFSFNDLDLHDRLGHTAHHPRYKIAFKFQGEAAITKIKDISWSISRNGYLTPVANVEPVELSGAKISRVTLHNYGMVAQHDLKTGDQIEIVRSGEVIPKFLEVKKASKNKLEIPTKCPSCNAKTVIDDIRLLCSNQDCPGRNKESILNFIQKIGIDDLSSKRLDELLGAGLVKKIPDLYRLKKEQLTKLDKVKDKLASKLINTIDESKKVDLTTFLSSLGITGGAYNKCEKVVSQGHNTIAKVKKLTVDKLMEIESFAEKSSMDFLSSLTAKFPLIDELTSLGFKFSKVAKENTSLSGKKICITGSLTEKRSIIEGRIREAGGIVVSSVSSGTDYLLTNDTNSNSSKFVKAKKLNISIVSEKKLASLLKETT
ncbi:MAG: DNA ligase (NAD(+)) LigA [Deltaproteobacteria bacterium]|nr:MAG: DNA ligase (NAD(+)) LigA [Deltaproteobacteria bacterium]